MENSTIFFAYLAIWCVYLVVVYAFGRHRRLHLGILSISHLVPSAVAIIMICIFLIGGGVTVAQYAAESESGMDMWSLWADLWPVLLFFSAASGIVHLVWAFVACMKKNQRKWIPVAIATVLMSVFALYTVLCNFPDA